MARILVIEDNPASMELICYLLKAFGHTVLKATDGEQGEIVARDEMPDLILCDVQLPVVDGFELARRLAEDPQLSNIPRIAVTALAMVGDRDKVLGAGFDCYIAKPIVPETFVSQIEAMIRVDSAHDAT